MLWFFPRTSLFQGKDHSYNQGKHHCCITMATADPVKCSCKNNCIRPPGREGTNTRHYCKCFSNGTPCTYLCKCGTGKIDCANTIDAHLDDAELYEEGDLYDEQNDPLFVVDERETQLAVFFQDHDGEITVDAEDILNTSTQEVAAAQADREVSFMENPEGMQEKPTSQRKGRSAKEKKDYDAAVEDLTKKLSHYTADQVTSLVLKLSRLHPDLVAMAMEPNPEPRPPGAEVPFCNCGMCRPMPTPQEQLCCSLLPGSTCILLAEETRGPINQIVLSRRALQVAIHNHNEYCVQEDDVNDNACLRHMAYRKFVLWQRGYLGPGKRVVIPSCVVWSIRDRYPSPDGTYTGFIPSQVFHN